MCVQVQVQVQVQVKVQVQFQVKVQVKVQVQVKVKVKRLGIWSSKTITTRRDKHKMVIRQSEGNHKTRQSNTMVVYWHNLVTLVAHLEGKEVTLTLTPNITPIIPTLTAPFFRNPLKRGR